MEVVVEPAPEADVTLTVHSAAYLRAASCPEESGTAGR
jgi:hypothetical protein